MLNKHEAFIIEIIIYSHLFIYVCAGSKQIRELFDDALRNARRSAEYHLHEHIKKIAKYANFQGDRFSAAVAVAVTAAGRPSTVRWGGDGAVLGIWSRWEVNVRRRFRVTGWVGRESGCGSRGSVLAAASKVRLVPPLSPTRNPARHSHTRARQSGYSTANAAGRDIRGCPPPLLLSDLDPGPASTGLRWRHEGGPREPASKRRCQFGRTAGATFLRARPIPPGRFVFWRRALRHQCGVRQRSQSLDQSTGKVIGGRLNSHRKRVITHTHTLTHTHTHIHTHTLTYTYQTYTHTLKHNTHTHNTHAHKYMYTHTHDTRARTEIFANDAISALVIRRRRVIPVCEKKNNYNNNKKNFIVPCVLSIECRRVTRTLQAPKWIHIAKVY